MKSFIDVLTAVSLFISISGYFGKNPWVYGSGAALFFLVLFFGTLLPAIKVGFAKGKNHLVLRNQKRRVKESLSEIKALLIEYRDLIGDRNGMHGDALRFLIRDTKSPESEVNKLFNDSFYYQYLTTLIRLANDTLIPSIALCEMAVGFNLINQFIYKLWPKIDDSLKTTEECRQFVARYNEKIGNFEKLFRKVPFPLEYPSGYNGCGNHGFERNFERLI